MVATTAASAAAGASAVNVQSTQPPGLTATAPVSINHFKLLKVFRQFQMNQSL